MPTRSLESDGIVKQVWLLTEHVMFLGATIKQLVRQLAEKSASEILYPEKQ